MTALYLRFRYVVLSRIFPMHGVTILKVVGYVLIPLILAVAGNHFAAEVIKGRKKRWMWRIIFIGLGLGGVLIVAVVEKKIDDEHAIEVTSLTSTMSSVQQGNTAILQHLTKPPLSAQDQEISRRQDILALLRHEWILSHKHISPGLLAGTEEPPSDWVNQHLRELGEKWMVEDAQSKTGNQQTTQQMVRFYGNLKQRSATLAKQI